MVFYYQPGKPVVDYLIKVRFAIVCFRRIIINEKLKKNYVAEYDTELKAEHFNLPLDKDDGMHA